MARKLFSFLFFFFFFVAGADDTIPENSGAVHKWFSNTIKQSNRALDSKIVRAEKNKKVITVRQDGAGDFRTITDAVNSIPPGNNRRIIIRIGPGVYNEKVTVDGSKPFVTFYGEPNSMPRISHSGTAATYGTWDSATVIVEASYFMACNIIFENGAPRPMLGVEGAQAVALRISGERAAFYNCKFNGYQDTVCDDKGMHFFKDCSITGTTDFIFGNGRSVYLNCALHSVANSYGVITAQGRDTKEDYSGFSFVHCKISGTGDLLLGRAWRQRSRVVFAYTLMGNNVDPKGWDDMGLTNHHEKFFYGEYKCMGPGAETSKRVNYARVLTDTQAKPFLSLNFVLASKWLLPPPKL